MKIESNIEISKIVDVWYSSNNDIKKTTSIRQKLGINTSDDQVVAYNVVTDQYNLINSIIRQARIDGEAKTGYKDARLTEVQKDLDTNLPKVKTQMSRIAVKYARDSAAALRSQSRSRTVDGKIKHILAKLEVVGAPDYNKDKKQFLEYVQNAVTTKKENLIACQTYGISTSRIISKIDDKLSELDKLVKSIAPKPALDENAVWQVVRLLDASTLSLYERMGVNKIFTNGAGKEIDLTDKSQLSELTHRDQLALNSLIKRKHDEVNKLLTEAASTRLTDQGLIDIFRTPRTSPDNPFYDLKSVYDQIKGKDERDANAKITVTEEQLREVLRQCERTKNDPYKVLGIACPDRLESMTDAEKSILQNEIVKQADALKAIIDAGVADANYAYLHTVLGQAKTHIDTVLNKINDCTVGPDASGHASRLQWKKQLELDILALQELENKKEDPFAILGLESSKKNLVGIKGAFNKVFNKNEFSGQVDKAFNKKASVLDHISGTPTIPAGTTPSLLDGILVRNPHLLERVNAINESLRSSKEILQDEVKLKALIEKNSSNNEKEDSSKPKEKEKTKNPIWAKLGWGFGPSGGSFIAANIVSMLGAGAIAGTILWSGPIITVGYLAWRKFKNRKS